MKVFPAIVLWNFRKWRHEVIEFALDHLPIEKVKTIYRQQRKISAVCFILFVIVVTFGGYGEYLGQFSGVTYLLNLFGINCLFFYMENVVSTTMFIRKMVGVINESPE